MSEQTIKLTTEEISKLNTLFRKSRRDTIKYIIGTVIVLFLISLIPPGILDLFSQNHNNDNNEDFSHTLIQHMGFTTWLIISLLILGLIAFGIVRSTKIFQLQKDLKEGEKLELDVVVISKVTNEKTDDYSMIVNSDTLKNKKIILTKEQYGQFTVGQNLTIDAYKNSMILLSSMPK